METEELLKKVRRIEIKARGLSNNIFAGEYHSAFKGRGMAFSEVREYQYGDDVRDIDWNVTARIDRPYVKVYEEERELTVILMIDVSGSLDFGTSQQTKREMATEIAATLAFSAIQNNDKIGVIFFFFFFFKFIPPKKGRKHILFIIRELLMLKAESKHTDIGKAIEFMDNAIKKRCTAFIMSDFFDNKDFSRQLQVANRRHDVIALQIYDQRMLELPNVGLIKVRDLETDKDIIIDTSSKKVRKAHHEWWIQHQIRFSQILASSKVDCTHLRTDEDFVQGLSALFQRRK